MTKKKKYSNVDRLPLFSGKRKFALYDTKEIAIINKFPVNEQTMSAINNVKRIFDGKVIERSAI